jgi:tetraacyldisaccharide-1-P 4'-kinase
VEFEDHHRYRPNELMRIAEQLRRRGATALVTTEKDAVNLCDGADELLAPLPLYWLKIGMLIENEVELLDEIERRIAN